MNLVLLVSASVFFALGGVFMKYSEGLTRLGATAVFFALFMAGAACQALAIKRAEMSVAYTFVLGLEAITAFLLSVVVLGEKATAAKIGALVLIVSGIVLLERG